MLEWPFPDGAFEKTLQTLITPRDFSKPQQVPILPVLCAEGGREHAASGTAHDGITFLVARPEPEPIACGGGGCGTGGYLRGKRVRG